MTTLRINNKEYHVELKGSALAGTNSDFFHWAKFTYTAYGTP